MGRKLEWELSGKSDVPQKMAQAKSSMEGLEGASSALSKKFKEAFKDIALGFVAPMILVQKAIGFITDQFEKLRQFAQESRDFAKEADSAKYFRPGAREAILQGEERKKERESKMKGSFGTQLGYAEFLSDDPRGKAMMREAGKSPSMVTTGAGPFSFLNPIIAALGAKAQTDVSAQVMATDPAVRAKIDAMLAGDISKRTEAQQAEKAKETAAVAKGLDVGSNVVGVGMSPQLDALNKSVAIQEDMANSLRTLIERDGAATGFKTEKFWPSANRPPAR
jgi:F0F1-type ATP synthase assembly protein I